MGDNTGKSWVREILVGIIVAVGAAAIVAWLGLEKNNRNTNPPPIDRSTNPAPVDRDTHPAPVTSPVTTTAPVPTEVQSIDLSGDWVEPGGNVVTITQNGNRVTLRMPYLEAMGILTTQSGTVEPSSDRRYLAYVSASNGATTAQFNVTRDGNRLVGWVSNGFSKSPAILIRRE